MTDPFDWTLNRPSPPPVVKYLPVAAPESTAPLPVDADLLVIIGSQS
jgi:hypothetical protein